MRGAAAGILSYWKKRVYGLARRRRLVALWRTKFARYVFGGLLLSRQVCINLRANFMSTRSVSKRSVPSKFSISNSLSPLHQRTLIGPDAVVSLITIWQEIVTSYRRPLHLFLSACINGFQDSVRCVGMRPYE